MTPSRANLKRLLSINIILELVLNRFTWPKVEELHVKEKERKQKVRKPLRKQRLQGFNPIDRPIAKHIGIISFYTVMS